ncbi:MAG: hypothetical protein M0P91_05275 [Sulfuricurvum sp.]|uniref:hypothetical protein n=1 Tax=Sulfuricurvum sp. TaxID=2025608 RepID=UPI0025CE5454|nr:hypothetical protein [Sulfuricurvum sp.]MCK9372587.1 hypothetical protein [Sulfuricurvum sp.]
MAKKQLLFADAERLYVIDQCTMGDIASRLRIHEKTVANWKEEGDWENKRRNHLSGKQAFHEELYDFSRKLMQSIKADMDADKEVSPGRFFALTKMLPMLIKTKDYEEIIARKEKEEEKKGSGSITEETMRLIEEELGIR